MASARPTPALPPPPGRLSNFENPESLLKWDILCVTICLSIATVVFVLRTWVRAVVSKQWILEDYMCCISYVGRVLSNQINDPHQVLDGACDILCVDDSYT